MSKLNKLSDVMTAVVGDYRERLKEPEKFKLVPSGLEAIDELTGGGLPNPVDKLIVGIGGAWKMGKTALTVQISTLQCALDGQKTGFFALEELNEQTALRVFARHIVDLTRSRLYRMDYTEADLQTMEQLAEEFVNVNMYVTDDVFTPDEIIKIAVEDELDRVIVDNMNLTEEKGENESKRLDNAMRKFVHARNNLRKNFTIVYQLNDQGQALGSRSLYRGADLFFQINPVKDTVSGKPVDGLAEIEMLRGRRGKESKAIVGFNGDSSRFYNIVRMELNDPEFLSFIEEIEEDVEIISAGDTDA